MANEQFAFIERGKVPSRTQWQKAIDEAGFDLQLDEGLEPFGHSGFLPCKLFGADSGVETYYDAAMDVISDPNQLQELAGGRDFCISFRWGGDFRDAACAMILSYSLARSFSAVISYEGEAPYATLEALQKDTEDIIKQVQK
ncbi:MAG TPA: hypothetical protein VMP01_14905 [Pirellulaceae bacterium]|nr:hypothetical protein [Pirellulaceae bacterium]